MTTKQQHGDKGSGSGTAQQSQKSEQSMQNPAGRERTPRETEGQTGIGSSQRQDAAHDREKRPPGTADIERGSHEQGGSDPGASESLTQDPVGAYKERP